MARRKGIEMEHERQKRLREQDKRRFARLQEQYERIVGRVKRERAIAQQFVDALQAQRIDDAEYILDLVSPTVTRRSVSIDALQQAQAAAYRMKEGKAARPIDEDDDGCPVGDPDCLGNDGDCHDACEPASERIICPHYPNTRPQDCGKCVSEMDR